MARDPVCGMQIKESDAAGTIEYQGKTYYFCSESCKGTFEKDPAKYADKSASGSEHEHHH